MPLLSLRNSGTGSDAWRALQNRLLVLWRAGDFEECDRTFQTLLASARNSNSPLDVALILVFSARLENYRKSYTASAHLLKEAETILNGLSEAPASLTLAWLLERARLSRGERTPSQARLAYAEAWTIAVGTGDDEACVEIVEMMAETEPLKMRISWIEKGIEITLASSSEFPKRRLSSLYRAQGRDHHELRRYADAIISYGKSAAAAKASGNLNDELLADSAKGKTLRIMLKTDEALELQMGLLAGVESSGVQNGEVYEEIAECLQTLKRVEEAEPYFASAYHAFTTDPHFEDRRPGVLKRLKTLAKIRNS